MREGIVASLVPFAKRHPSFEGEVPELRSPCVMDELILVLVGLDIV